MTFSEDDMSDCTTQLYNPDEMTVQAREYKDCFDRYLMEFGAKYKIYVVENSMKLAIGIVDPRFERNVAAITWLKYYNNEPLSDPLSPTVIQAVKNRLTSLAERFGD